ncbi:MAG: TonB-dependent receptor, partial [Phaeodactylibacter sp.]|nr:TonB-dependent receptor [Phaeodactylibacter sp.]
EMLRYTPGVYVDPSGNISMNGKNGVRIFMDDRPVYVQGEQLKSLLSSIPSTSVERIEVITNPSAKYDAEGMVGIINIVLQGEQNTGLNGNVQAAYSLGLKDAYNAGINLGTKLGNATYFVNYDYAHKVIYSQGTLDRIPDGQPGLYRVFNEIKPKDSHFLNAGMDWKIGARQAFGLKGTFSQSAYDGTIHSLTKVQDGADLLQLNPTYSHLSREFLNYGGNANYQVQLDTFGQQLEFNYDYAAFVDLNNSDFQAYFIDQEGGMVLDTENLRGESPIDIQIHTGNIDYTLPLKEAGELELGGKYSRIRTDNDIRYDVFQNGEYSIDPNRTNHFIYTEQIRALYANWNGQLGEWGLQFGLRAEHTDAEGYSETLDTSIFQNYWGLFPSFFLQRTINEEDQLNFSFSNRIVRPDYADLNPFEVFIDPFLLSRGNPALIPERGTSLELTYLFKSRYALTFGGNYIRNAINEISRVDQNSDALVYQPENIGANFNINASFGAPLEITKWWTANLQVAYFYGQFLNEEIIDQVAERQHSYYGYIANRFELPGGLDVQVIGQYQGPFIYGIYRFEPISFLTLALQKRFDSGLTLKLKAADLFNGLKQRYGTDFQGNRIDVQQFYDQRRLSLSVNYAFSRGADFSVRQQRKANRTETSRVKSE